jgi:acyl-coenzyme A thioesterase PaaI-like protein
MDDATLDALTRHNPYCLGCGDENSASVGFRIDEVAPGRLRARVAFTRFHEGAPGRVHGGAVTIALDEAIGQLAQLEIVGDCLTAEIAVKYLRPTGTDASYAIDAHLSERDGRKLWIDATLVDESGNATASATALMIAARPVADAG